MHRPQTAFAALLVPGLTATPSAAVAGVVGAKTTEDDVFRGVLDAVRITTG